ncbi:MAG: hypothetical protein JWL66_2409 [Sphingomonadales bacterium]|nr:hypothetical protein [Sphingomonadales bacterium]
MLSFIKSAFVQRLMGGFAFGAITLLATPALHL